MLTFRLWVSQHLVGVTSAWSASLRSVWIKAFFFVSGFVIGSAIIWLLDNLVSRWVKRSLRQEISLQ